MSVSKETRCTDAEVTALENFFQSSVAEDLKSVTVNVPICPHVSATLLFQILDHCGRLRELKYLEDGLWLHDDPNLNNDELAKLRSQLSKLDKVSISEFVLKPKSHSLSTTPSSCDTVPALGPRNIAFHGTLRILAVPYGNLQHLALDVRVQDCILKEIFKNFVSYAALLIRTYPYPSVLNGVSPHFFFHRLT